MVNCLKCTKQMSEQLNFKQQQQYYKLSDSWNVQRPYMLIENQSNGYYQFLCSQICSNNYITQMSAVIDHTEDKFDLIFRRSQIGNGIIEKLTNLRNFIDQEVILTENAYQIKNILDIKEEFRVQISKAISEIADNITNKLIQHLEEAIKFSMSETEKINYIKQTVEKLLNDQGNNNLIDIKGHWNLYELDIKKYRVDEMIQLMEKIQLVKKEISEILSQKNTEIIQNI